jgi:hypothetical protein
VNEQSPGEETTERKEEETRNSNLNPRALFKPELASSTP